MQKLVILFLAQLYFTPVVAEEKPIEQNQAATQKSLTNTSSPSVSGETQNGGTKFEIVDGTAQIEGDPNLMEDGARSNWHKACDQWLSAFRSTNKQTILDATCNAPTCGQHEHGGIKCNSIASYKLKIAGEMVRPTPPAPVPETITTVVQAPPETIYEVEPLARPGFIWAAGFWGWHMLRHRYVWYPGHWEREQVGLHWHPHHWEHVRSGWRFQVGGWH